VAAVSYLDRKLAGLCTRPGCSVLAPDDSCLCETHRADNRARIKRLYKKRKAAKLCPKCGVRKPRPGSWGCAVCATKAGEVSGRPRGRPPKNPPNTNSNNAESRVAAATSVDKDGRSRYHGRAERGRQPTVDLDRQDLVDAARCLGDGRAAVEYLWTTEIQALPRAQKLEVRAAAMSWLQRAKRWIDEVLVRNGALPAKPEDDEK
jgi:hypothetical protein